MTDVAQTNAQLYEQMIRDGASNHELEVIAKSYNLMMRLCTGLYRPNGKPFVCHLVGTASILHRIGAPFEVVAAGLLHSVYSHGDFGTAAGRITAKKREIVRASVGQDIEELVYRYAIFEWDHTRLEETRARLPQLTHHDRQALLMRLADYLDDNVDMGRLYERSASKEVERQERRDTFSSLAREAGYPTLADSMDQISDQMKDRIVRTELIRDDYGRSFSVPPKSYRRKLPAALGAASKTIRSSVGGLVRSMERRISGK